MINIKKVQAVINSNITAYEIEKQTGISRAQIGNYRNGKHDIMNMSLNNALKLQNYYEEEMAMNYEKELERLEKENGINGNLNVSTHENKEELLERLSENADDPKETHEYMKEELSYLADDRKLFSVDIGNGEPSYYDNAQEAYDSI